MESKEHSQMVMLTTSTDTLSLLTNNSDWMDESFFAQLNGADRNLQFSNNNINDNGCDDSSLYRDFFVPSPNSFNLLANQQAFPDSPQSMSSYVQSSPDSSEVSYDSSPFSPTDRSPHFPTNSLKNSNSLLLDIDSITQQQNTTNNFTVDFPMDVTQTNEMNYFEQLINQINTKELSLYPESNSNIDSLDVNPSKKRKRGDEGKISSKNDPFTVQNAQRPIFLDRQQLLQYSSKDFDEYKKKLLQTYTLSVEEKETLKKQRRVIKNREYSQNSRQKKKQRVEELEIRIAQIEEENQKLRRENNSLKSKLLNIVSSYRQSKQIGNTTVKIDPHINNNSINNNNKSGFESFFSIKGSNQKAMVGCVFIILLSFGFLFANHSTNQLSKVKSSQTGRVVFSNNEEESNSILSFLWQNSVGYLYYYTEIDEETDSDVINYKNRIMMNQKLNNDNNVSQKREVSTYYGSYSDDPHLCETIPSDALFLINTAFFMKNITEMN